MTDRPDPEPPSSPRSTSRRRRVLLWALALLMMLGAASYQRRTGPTKPLSGAVELGGEVLRYELIRSDWSDREQDAARVLLRDPFDGEEGDSLEATLRYRRFKTDDPFVAAPMTRERVDDRPTLIGLLPAQPAAGKLEYTIELRRGSEVRHLPEESGETVVIRFKDHVPTAILLPHVLLMFLALLFALRAGIGALFDPDGTRFRVRAAFAGMTVGGMVLGPLVQKHAFGAYWTGFPLGGDWTDNKMLVMWLAWVVALAVVELFARRKAAIARGVVLAAAVVTIVAYLIPHSTRGSELDYSQVDRGVDPAEAIETGR